MRPAKGMSFVDVIIGSAFVLVLFLAFFGLLRASLLVSAVAKAKAGATAIATSQIEYVRSLTYDQIGTVGGIPAGIVPQTATSTLNGIDYVVRTFIEYTDDPADGEGVADENGITTDYKVVKVAVTYEERGLPREIAMVTNAVPPGIETTTGGGTLRVDVADAVGAAVAGATVRIVNDAVSPAIDLTTFSDAAGTVLLGGAPTSTDYQVYVSKDGYSSAQTYERDATNQNPTPGYLTVVENTTTAGTFAIDVLGTLIVSTFTPVQAALWTDLFNDGSGLADSDGTTVDAGALVLAGAPGAYPAAGDARSVAVAPTYLAEWENASSTLSTPLGTEVEFSVATGAGLLIPDTDLPGNSAGFTGVVDLSGLSTTTYPSLSLVANLSSSDPMQTPSVLDWGIGYDEGPIPEPNVPLTLTGTKTIGSTGAGDPLYKHEIATTTGATGVLTIELEWDSYDVAVTGYTVVSEEPLRPYEVLPAVATSSVLILAP